MRPVWVKVAARSLKVSGASGTQSNPTGKRVLQKRRTAALNSGSGVLTMDTELLPEWAVGARIGPQGVGRQSVAGPGAGRGRGLVSRPKGRPHHVVVGQGGIGLAAGVDEGHTHGRLSLSAGLRE